MLKVITVTTFANLIKDEDNVSEVEYPILNKYLEEGYIIIKTIPIERIEGSFAFSVVFILDK